MPDRSSIFKNNQRFLLFFDHLACAALRAASLRCIGVMLAVRAGPPFNPPSLPSATAAGFFLDVAFLAMPGAWHEKKSD
jgi:hypothetical protein